MIDLVAQPGGNSSKFLDVELLIEKGDAVISASQSLGAINAGPVFVDADVVIDIIAVTGEVALDFVAAPTNAFTTADTITMNSIKLVAADKGRKIIPIRNVQDNGSPKNWIKGELTTTGGTFQGRIFISPK